MPASSQATWRRCRTWPVSVSTSTTATCAPNGNVGAAARWKTWCRSSAGSPSAFAAAASSAHVLATAGVPATWNAPASLSSTTSASSASSSFGGQLLGLLDELDRRLVARPRHPAAASASPSCRRRRARGRCRPRRASILSIGMPVCSWAIMRPRGDVALAVRRGAGVDDGPSRRRCTSILACSPIGGDAAGDLDVDADADAELLGVAAARGAPPARRAARCSRPRRAPCRARRRSRRRRRSGRSTVVCGSVNLGIRLLAAHFGRVHADLGGEHVHHPLDRRGRLRATGAAVGDDRRRVGDDAAWCGTRCSGCRRRADDIGRVMNGARIVPMLGEAAAVLDGMQPVVRDLAVAAAADA